MLKFIKIRSGIYYMYGKIKNGKLIVADSIIRNGEKIDYLLNKGIKLEIDRENYYDDMIYFFEKRNAIVHNKSEFNIFNIKKLKNTKYKNSIKSGEKIIVDIDMFKNESEIVIKVANSLYESICKKYNLLNKYIIQFFYSL